MENIRFVFYWLPEKTRASSNRSSISRVSLIFQKVMKILTFEIKKKTSLAPDFQNMEKLGQNVARCLRSNIFTKFVGETRRMSPRLHQVLFYNLNFGLFNAKVGLFSFF